MHSVFKQIKAKQACHLTCVVCYPLYTRLPSWVHTSSDTVACVISRDSATSTSSSSSPHPPPSTPPPLTSHLSPVSVCRQWMQCCECRQASPGCCVESESERVSTSLRVNKEMIGATAACCCSLLQSWHRYSTLMKVLWQCIPTDGETVYDSTSAYS